MIKRSNGHTHGRGCMVNITCADDKQHVMAYERMVELIQKPVRELHVADYDNACQICIKGLDYDENVPIYEEWPCPTIQALDGEQ